MRSVATSPLLVLCLFLAVGTPDPVFYRRTPNYYHTSPYQRRPYFPTYQQQSPPPVQSHVEDPLVAIVDLVPGGDSGVSGKLVMVQRFPNSGGGVLITGQINGLRAGKHGFHVHMKGELGNNCKDAAGHFNPFMVKKYVIVAD